MSSLTVSGGEGIKRDCYL